MPREQMALHEAFCLYEDADRFKPYEKHHSTVKDACEAAQKLHVENLACTIRKIRISGIGRRDTRRKENSTLTGISMCLMIWRRLNFDELYDLIGGDGEDT